MLWQKEKSQRNPWKISNDLIKKTHIPLQRLQSILLDLEMKHMIEKVHSKGYINIIGSDVLVH